MKKNYTIFPIPEGKARLNAPVSLFRGCVSPDTKAQHHATLAAVFRQLFAPSRELLDFSILLKGAYGTSKYKRLKQGTPDGKEPGCPAFIIGHFTHRRNDAFNQYVPLLGFDVDSCPSDKVYENLEKCQNSPYIFAAFPSPSLHGLRLFVWVDSTPETHESYYLAVIEHLSETLNIPTDKQLRKQLQEEGASHAELRKRIKETEHFDTSTRNLARLWFYSSIPKKAFYHNLDSEVFHLDDPPVAPIPASPITNTPPHPKQNGYRYEFSQREKVEQLTRQIMREKVDITRGPENWFKIGCALASEFGESGRDLFHNVSQFHPDYNFPKAEAEYNRCLRKQNGKVSIASFWQFAKEYGIQIDYEELKAKHPDVFERQQPPHNGQNLQAEPQKKEPSIQQETCKEDEPEEFFKFYYVKKDGEKREVKINFLLLVKLLYRLGFRRYDRDGEFFIVRVIENIVRECSKQEVIDTFESYILDFPSERLPEGITKDQLRNKIYGSIASYFSDHILGRLRPEKPIVFNEHTHDKAYFYYQNGYVEISAQGIELKPYAELEKCIWENQILKRDFQPIQPHQYQEFSFVQFTRNISNNWKEHPLYKRENPKSDPVRFAAFQTIIGYLLHAFFDTELKAVIFTDSRVDDEGEANGRSGKTLLLKALGYVLNRDFKRSTTYVELNGKDFDSSGTFKYQELGLDTRLVHLNDVKRNFKFEDLFNDVTEGIKRERKNEAPSIVRAKMAISTNRTIKIKGASAKGRSVELELAEYYDDNWTPLKEFSEWFFSDWSEEQWAQFDAFMMDCVQKYFQEGIIQPGTINLNERKKIEETALEFVYWMEDKASVFTDGSEWDKKELFEDFQARYPDFKWLTQRRFTDWLRTYCLYDEEYAPVNPNQDERRSNGASLITFRRKATKPGGETDDLPF